MIGALIYTVGIVVCVAAMCWCTNSVIKALNGQTNAHQRCHEQAESLLQMSTVRAEAQALRRAANLWDSVEEEQAKRVLAHEKYVQGGPSIPAIWLREQATKLDGKTHD